MHPKGTCSASLHCVGIAPYEMPIEVRSVKRREGQSPSPTDVFTIVPLYRAWSYVKI